MSLLHFYWDETVPRVKIARDVDRTAFQSWEVLTPATMCNPAGGATQRCWGATQYSHGDSATPPRGPNKTHNRESSRGNLVQVLAPLQEKIQQQEAR